MRWRRTNGQHSDPEAEECDDEDVAPSSAWHFGEREDKRSQHRPANSSAAFGARPEAAANPTKPQTNARCAEPAAEEQQTTERQCIGGNHPGPRVVAHTQAGPERGQRDRHHRGIQHDHELGESGCRQDPPLTV